MLHSLLPFAINLISGIVIIAMSAQRRSKIHSNQSYQKILWKKIQQNSHLLVAPLALVILAILRLIISFIAGCMKIARKYLDLSFQLCLFLYSTNFNIRCFCITIKVVQR